MKKNYLNVNFLCKGNLKSLMLLVVVIFSFSTSAFAQSGSNFLLPSDSINSGRIRLLAIGGTVGYSATLIGLSQAWYKDYPKSSFHFFDDRGEWMDMDKYGHFLTSYFETEWARAAYRWAGMEENKQLWYAAGTSLLMQSTIEVLDGFSSQWGFSVPDMVANVSGPALYILQEKLWQEQRIRLKFSVHYVKYDDYLINEGNGHSPVFLKDRVKSIYGRGYAERLLKDYNGQSYWISFNPFSISGGEKQFWPEWLNLAFGLSTENVFGGYGNRWRENGEPYVVPEDLYPRQRQYLMSLDVDLSKIPSRSPFVRTLLGMANVIKVPAPALEIDGSGELRGHILYW